MRYEKQSNAQCVLHIDSWTWAKFDVSWRKILYMYFAVFGVAFTIFMDSMLFYSSFFSALFLRVSSLYHFILGFDATKQSIHKDTLKPIRNPLWKCYFCFSFLLHRNENVNFSVLFNFWAKIYIFCFFSFYLNWELWAKFDYVYRCAW